MHPAFLLRLCARREQLFPRGAKSKPIDFNAPERSASAFYYFASRNIPHNVKKVYHLEDLPAWIEEVRVSASACPARTHAHAPWAQPYHAASAPHRQRLHVGHDDSPSPISSDSDSAQKGSASANRGRCARWRCA